jgi:imidazolonepropionase-like amidohydrolase
MKLFGLLAGCALMAGAASNDTFLIRDADVYPVTGPVMQGVSVLVQDGKIANIGAKLTPPKGIRIVEAKGLRVYPGMIDSATELGLQEIESVRETEDTGELGQFMPQLRALAAVNPASEHFPVVRVNGITSVMTFPSSGSAGAGGGGGGRFGGGERQFISGQAALIHTDGWTWDDMAIKPYAALHLIFPSMPRAGRGGVSGNPETAPAAVAGGAAGGAAQAKQTYQTQIDSINQFFDDARVYQKAKAANLPGFRTELKFEAMIPVLDGKVPVAITASRASAIHDAVQFAGKQNVKIVILEPHDLKQAAAELKEKNIPVILGRVLALPENEDDAYDSAHTLAAEAYKAGVKFALGTFGNEFVRNLPYEAAAAVAFGLPYDEALKAITINPAQIWGVADQVGSVEKGKWADLIVTNGDPLEVQTQISHLYMKGKEVELTNRQIELYHKYSNRP